MKCKKINVRKGRRYTFKTHINEILLAREEAEGIEAFHVIIGSGRSTHAHAHDDTEQLYHIIAGRGRVRLAQPDGRKTTLAIAPHDVVFVPRGVQHQVFCIGRTALRYLCIDGFPKGRPLNEPTWDDHYQTVVRASAKS